VLGGDECRHLLNAVGAETAPGLQNSAVPASDCDDRRLAVSEALDEVEAALDDRNLSRLLQVIGELGERSQLIVVTHQKRTMQIAETLYGVSMRGGVSTVLSQQMEELRELL